MATSLAPALAGAGHEIVQVYSRTLAAAAILAERVGAQPLNDLKQVVHDADVYIVCVRDAVLPLVASELCADRRQAVYLHTAGSMSMDVFGADVPHRGVIYPMQTFSKERLVDFAKLPLFIEGSDELAVQTARQIAESLGDNVHSLSGEGRKSLHLAAVFACNFVNHCYQLAAEVLEREHIPFSVMLPLVDETARKVATLSPREAQTGPAVRNDANVMEAHAAMLSDHPLAQQLYKLMSRSIHETAERKQ